VRTSLGGWAQPNAIQLGRQDVPARLLGLTILVARDRIDDPGPVGGEVAVAPPVVLNGGPVLNRALACLE
jgi:hypothetical protein